jgi:glycerol kinase
VWQDRRTASVCDELKKQGHEKTVKDKTGLVLDAYFSATKIRWILDKVPGSETLAREGKLAFGTIDSWLLYKLTNGKVHATDASNASRTMLFNIHTLEWDNELLGIFGIPAELLPEVKSNSEIFGYTDHLISHEPVPISGMAGDQQAALFGQLCIEPGMVKNTYGTGCFMVVNTGNEVIRSANNLVSTIGWKLGDEVTYALEGSIFVGGAVIQWLRDGLKIIRKSEESEPLAATVENNGGVYFVPALTGLGAPHWDPYARGTITGITRGTTSAHIARAALESIAFQSRDVLKAMEDDMQQTAKELRVDGGATSNNLLMQFQSDILGIPVRRPQVQETTALGAAFFAGLATGFWPSIEALKSSWKEDRKFIPGIDEEEKKKLLKHWDKAVQRAEDWEEH